MDVTKSNIVDKYPLCQAVITAAKQAGYSYTEDANGYMQEGFGTFDLTIKDGKRCGTGKAYMQAVKKRKNVDIFLKSQVQKIIIKNKTAKGIEITNKNRKEEIFADREVIISCGSINSPQLLMLSGIGNASELQKLNIEVIHNLPGVGKNLQDHLEIYTQFKCIQPVSLYSLFNNPMVKVYQGIQWFLFKKGMLSHTHLEAGGFVRSSEDYDRPNLQFHFFPSLVINHGLGKPDCHAFQFHTSPNRPTSRGWIKLRSPNPNDYPIIQFNYLETEDDRKQMRDSVRIARNIFFQDAFKPYLGEEISPGIDKKSDEDLDEVIRNNADTAYHPSCTNKMGVDQMSVVDSETKVYGIENLRVVDSSIMPNIISGNIHAATLMIAEKASDLILDKQEAEPIDVEYYQSNCDLVLESTIESLFITEKTWKPIVFQKPFLVWGGQGIHAKLKDLGFELYDELFDYSFDGGVFDPNWRRLNRLSDSIESYMQMEPDIFAKKIKTVKDKIVFNYNHYCELFDVEQSKRI